MSTRRTSGLLVKVSDRAWRLLVVLALVAVVLIGFIALAAVLMPVLLAVVVIPVGRPLYKQLAGNLPRSLAAALVLLAAVVILAAAGWLMMTSIAANWGALWAGVTDAIAVLTSWADDRISGLTDQQLATAEQNLEDLASSVSSVVVGGVTRSVTLLGAFLLGLFVFLMTFFFGLRDWDKFRTWALDQTAANTKPQVDHFFDRYSLVLRRYWRAQAMIGVFDALAIGIGLWLIGVPLAFPIAVLTFVLSFIPYLGAIVSGALAVFVALGAGGPTDAGLALLLSLLVFNTGENLVRPWLIGESVRMPTFVAFIASTIGVLLAGALGAIMAVPLVALISEFRRIFLTDENRAQTPS